MIANLPEHFMNLSDDEKSLCYHHMISSAESQKGINAVQCSVENQKGVIAIDFVQL